jgi:hypothetical protein
MEFCDPAWEGGPNPAPGRVGAGPPDPLKFTSMAWTGDGRLLPLGSFDGVGDALAVWRPGQERLAVRQLRLPADRAGSDSFVPRQRPRWER